MRSTELSSGTGGERRSLSNKRIHFGPQEEEKDETEIDWLSMKPKKPTTSGIQWVSQQQT